MPEGKTLEDDIRKLHGCLAGLSGIRHAGAVWVSAGCVASELERILAKNERRPGEGPDPAHGENPARLF